MEQQNNPEQLPVVTHEARGEWYYGAVCPNCGTDNPAGSRFCGNCSASLDGSMKFCAACDTYCNADSNYCHNCGEKLTDEILSYKSGRIAGNGYEFLLAMLSFVMPGYGLLKAGYKPAGLAIFIVAALLGLWQGLGYYLIFGAISLVAVLRLPER